MKLTINKLITISYSRNVALVALSAVALTIFAGSMRAQSVTNGNFLGSTGEINPTLDSWTSVGTPQSYNWVCSFANSNYCGFNGGIGTAGSTMDSAVTATGLPSADQTNFAALDGDYPQQPGGLLYQSISGLTIGKQYSVSFYWAGAQQTGFTGPTYDYLTVDLCTTAEVTCSGDQSTTPVNIAQQGFSGWALVSYTFTATATTEDLTFQATSGDGTYQSPISGNQEPPFALLDGVSIAAATTPEVSSSALLLTLMGIIGGLSRLKSKKNWLKRV